MRDCISFSPMKKGVFDSLFHLMTKGFNCLMLMTLVLVLQLISSVLLENTLVMMKGPCVGLSIFDWLQHSALSLTINT